MENRGLLEYEATGEITKNFLDDYTHLCKKIFSHWDLRMDLDEFTGYCTEKLTARIHAFDPNRSNIGNYCYNLILNEARRIHSLEQHIVKTEVEDVLLYKEAPEDSLIQDIWKFAVYAYHKGFFVDQDQLMADYQRSIDRDDFAVSPVCAVFCWLRYTGRI